MGRGTVISGGTDGEYQVSIDYGSQDAQEIIARLQDRQTEILQTVSDLEAELASVQSDLVAANSRLSTAISDYNNDNDLSQPVKDATQDLLYFRSREQQLVAELKVQNAMHADLGKEIERLQSLDLTETKTAWCVDFTESASGEVALLDINSDTQATVIAPGGRAHAVGDGVMVDRHVQSGAQLFFNVATLPGTQKHLPTYRAATITAINEADDTCDVSLDAATSTEQNININQSSTLTDVPVDYMTCDAEAFEVGDRVVVEFFAQNWATPTVIGFLSNPRPCGGDLLCFPVFISGQADHIVNRPSRGLQGAVDASQQLVSPRVRTGSFAITGEVLTIDEPPTSARDEVFHHRITMWTDQFWEYNGQEWHAIKDGSVTITGGPFHIWPSGGRDTSPYQIDYVRFQTDLLTGTQLRKLVITDGEWVAYEGAWGGTPVDVSDIVIGDDTIIDGTTVLEPGDPLPAEAFISDVSETFVTTTISELDKAATTAKILSRYDLPSTITVNKGEQQFTYGLLWAGTNPPGLRNGVINDSDGQVIGSVVAEDWYWYAERSRDAVGFDYWPPWLIEDNQITQGPNRTVFDPQFVDGLSYQDEGTATSPGFVAVYEKMDP